MALFDVKNAQRANTGVLTGGLSEVDRATGNNVAKKLETYDPTKRPGTPELSEVQNVAAQNPITAPTLNPASRPGFVQTVGLNTAPQDQFRAYQSTLAAQLAQQASGQGPSIAGMQAKKAQDAALAQTFAAMASQRGGQTALAAKNAVGQNAATQRQIANDSAIARLQEQQMAAQNLGQVAQGARGQDIGIASTQAQLQQQANELNSQQAQEFNRLQAQYAQMGLSGQQAQQQAALDVERMRQQREASLGGYSQTAMQEQRKAVSGILNQAGAIGTKVAAGS